MSKSIDRIHPSVAAALTLANIGETPNPKHITYSAKSFLALMAQDGAESIRAHFGVNPDGVTTLVFTAVDADGAEVDGDQGPIVIGIGRPCPPFCGGVPDNE